MDKIRYDSSGEYDKKLTITDGSMFMNKSLKLSFQKGDWLAVVLVIVLTVLTAGFFMPKNTASEKKIIQIFHDNQLIKECSPDGEESFWVEGTYRNKIVISGGSVSVAESNCPGEDCVHSGRISHAGRSIVCLPNKVEIRIVGVENEVDFVVR